MRRKVLFMIIIVFVLLGTYRYDWIARPMLEIKDTYGKGYNEVENENIKFYLQDYYIEPDEEKEGIAHISLYLNIVNTTDSEIGIDNLFYYYDPEMLLEKSESMTHYYKFSLLPHESRGFSLELTIPFQEEISGPEETKEVFINQILSYVDVVYNTENEKYHYQLGNITICKDYISEQYPENIQMILESISLNHREIDNVYWGLMIRNLNEEESIAIIDAYLINDGWQITSKENNEQHYYVKDNENIKVSYSNISPSSLFYEHYQTVVNVCQ